jgi:hypothetical protein
MSHLEIAQIFLAGKALVQSRDKESPNSSKIICWKKGVRAPSHSPNVRLNRTVWMPPPSSLINPLGPDRSLEGYCYDDIILEVRVLP